MIIPMLEAISNMIEIKDSDDNLTSIAKVESAKIMLDKIIEGMKEKGMGSSAFTDFFGNTDFRKLYEKTPTADTPNVASQRPKHPARVAKEGKVEIMVDAGIIKSIKNANDDTMLELDGRAMPWKDAIGKSFTEGKVL